MTKKNYILQRTLLFVAMLASVLTTGAQTTAFTQDFTAVSASTDPADYGFTVTGTAADGMSATVADGKLTLVSGGYANGSRGYDAKASFTAIPTGNEVTFSCTWATGNATGTNGYSRLILSDGTNIALQISYIGQNNKLNVNGTDVATSVARGQTFNVTATLNTTTQTITALSIGSAYTATEATAYVSTDCKSISTFQFSNWTRASWTNTSSIDNIVISYEEVAEDPSYVEPISSVTITGPQSMTFGSDPDTAHENAYTVTIKGTNGTIITEDNLNELVTDFNVVWDIKGFKTANDTEGQYCDSYGSFSTNSTGKVATTFDLRNVPMNFYGRMTATVTYNGTTTVAEQYVVALGDLTKTSNQVLPLAGYPKDFSVYPAALNGYNCIDDTYGTKSDPILGGWCAAGSDTHDAVLLADGNGTKYVRLTAHTAKKSHVLTKTITAPSAQEFFATRLRFNSAGGVVTLTSGYPFWSSSKYTCAASLSFDGTNITLNDTKLAKDENAVVFSKDTWYDVVLSVDATTRTCYALVYDTDGTLLGESGIIAWQADSASPTYFSIGMGNSNSSGSIDMAACEAFTPIADNDSYTLDTTQETLSIPNGETATLTASIKDVNGYAITQTATWSVVEEDMQQSVMITPDVNDSHKAVVSTVANAEAGCATIQVNIGGVTKTVALTLTSSAESVKFTQSTTSITIPLEADGAVRTTFAAIVVDGSGNDQQRDVTLAAYQKDGTTAYENTEAISFDTTTGVLTVTGAAAPMTLVIRATGLNSNNEPLTKSVSVNIHGMKFDFGYTDDASIAEGFTPVGSSTSYNNTAGYGIVSGTATAGGTEGSADATVDYLSGAIEFDFKVQKGNFYTVTVTYQGVLTTGYINSDLAGYTLGTQTTLTTQEFTIPATTDIIDLRIATGTDITECKVASVSVAKQPVRTKRAKRKVHHIGDSTSANNGSWAYRLSKMAGTYPELFALCDFENNGAGGRNLSTYYTQGKLASVLNDIYPGDIVMFGNNGTNGMGSSFEADVNYYLNAAETLGAQVIINSYTPHGAVSSYASGYNTTTNTFDSYRKDSYDNITRKVAEERAGSDENYLGFVEIGKNADAAFNAYVADYANNGYASKDAAAQAIIACFPDHNHYNNATLACDLMLNGYGSTKGIVAQLIDILSAEPTPNAKTISQWGWITYSSTMPVSFGEGTEAYIAVAATESEVTLRKVTAIPANTGVLLKGTANTAASISYTNGATDDVTDNLLVSTANAAVSISSGYVLSATAAEESLGFYKVTSTRTVPRYSAYLPTMAGSRQVLSFIFENETTGISEVSRVNDMGEGAYDLLGRRVSISACGSLKKGLYIIRGKKIMIK